MARRAFTIVELLIAIGLLAVVIIAASKILGTTTQVSGLGEANANVTQEAEAVEKQLRQDLARIDFDGYLVVRCVAVRNNVNVLLHGAGAPLLDPSRGPLETLRCDQLVFFAKGAEDTQQFVGGNADSAQSRKMAPRTASSRIVYGHGVQLPDAAAEASGPVRNPLGFEGESDGANSPMRGPLVPWAWDPPGSGSLSTTAGVENGAQPEARQWVLARQATLLSEDGGNALLHQGFPAIPTMTTGPVGPDGTIATATLAPPADLAWSRTDVCSQHLSDLRRSLELTPTGTRRRWREPSPFQPFGFDPSDGIRARIINATFGAPSTTLRLGNYPRAEKRAPGASRADLMLTAGMVLRNCSEFMVDWTWSDSTGEVLNPSGSVALLATPQAPGPNILPILWGVRHLGFESQPPPDASDPRRRPRDWNAVANTPPLPYAPDWVGRDPDDPLFVPPSVFPQPWFGFGDYMIASGSSPADLRIESPAARSSRTTTPPRGVVTLQAPSTWFWRGSDNAFPVTLTQQSAPIFYEPIDGPLPSRIEGARLQLGSGSTRSDGPWEQPYLLVGQDLPVHVYTAVFGFNSDSPTEVVTVTDSNGITRSRTVLRDDYTPWPTALRFTMRLHDGAGKLVEGRTYNFVVDLPRRGVRRPAVPSNALGVIQ